MKKVLGITILLLAVCALSWIIEPKFATAYNIENIIHWTSLYAIISMAISFVIITGGIDLSIGSVVGLVGCLLAFLIHDKGWSVSSALVAVLGLSIAIGLVHGLLIAKMRLQPFIVTLCGMLIYRSLLRWDTEDKALGFGTGAGLSFFTTLAKGKVPIPGIEGFSLPVPFFIMIGMALIAGFFLNWTVYGRYLYALGSNEDAARYSGIRTERMTILAYVLCSFFSGIAGVLFAFYYNSMQSSAQGSSYEVYAIAAAVLGGCSLRGGEGTILGVIIGTAILRVLYNSINVLGIPTQLDGAIVGFVILAGVLADELFKRYAARRRSLGA